MFHKPIWNSACMKCQGTPPRLRIFASACICSSEMHIDYLSIPKNYHFLRSEPKHVREPILYGGGGGGYLYILCFHLGEKTRFPEMKSAIGKNLKYKTRTLQSWNNCHYMSGENSVKYILSKRHTRLVLRNLKAQSGIFWFRIKNDQLLFCFINMRHICIYFLYY